MPLESFLSLFVPPKGTHTLKMVFAPTHRCVGLTRKECKSPSRCSGGPSNPMACLLSTSPSPVSNERLEEWDGLKRWPSSRALMPAWLGPRPGGLSDPEAPASRRGDPGRLLPYACSDASWDPMASEHARLEAAASACCRAAAWSCCCCCCRSRAAWRCRCCCCGERCCGECCWGWCIDCCWWWWSWAAARADAYCADTALSVLQGPVTLSRLWYNCLVISWSTAFWRASSSGRVRWESQSA